MALSIRAKKIALLIIAITLLIAVFLHYLPKSASEIKHSAITSPTNTQTQTFIYKGVDGKDALALLRSQATVVLDSTGMVVSINNVKADANKHQYWEFFVNGKSSDIGSAQYITKNSDVLMWKLETY